MATFLETGMLNYFSIIFPVILVWIVVYMLLEKTKILGDSKSLHAVAATMAAFLVMLSRDIIEIINFGAPWFVMVFVFLVLLILIYRFMGATEENLANVVTKDKPIQWAILAVGLIIVIASISHVYGQRLLEQTPEDNMTISEGIQEERKEGTFRGEIYDTLFDPKVLGLLLIFLIAVFTISLLTRE